MVEVGNGAALAWLDPVFGAALGAADDDSRDDGDFAQVVGLGQKDSAGLAIRSEFFSFQTAVVGDSTAVVDGLVPAPEVVPSSIELPGFEPTDGFIGSGAGEVTSLG